MLEQGQTAAAEALAQAFPESHAGHLIGLYYRGCARMRAADDQAALGFFARFRDRVAAFTSVVPFLTSPYFNVIYRQGTLVAGAEAFAAEADPGPPPEPGETPVWQAPPTAPDGRPVFVCAANNLYFNRFAQGLARSAADLGLPLVLHFHILNPDDDSRRVIATLTGDPGLTGVAIDLSTATLPPDAGAVWFSCARFLAAPALLQAYQTPLWLLDIDLDLTPGLVALVQGLAQPDDMDLGYFDTGRLEPASRFSAATVFLNTRPGTRDFLALLDRFLRPRLRLPLAAGWMLDQAALYSVTCHCRRTRPDIALVDFTQRTGLGRDDVFVSLHPETKNAMRWNPSGNSC